MAFSLHNLKPSQPKKRRKIVGRGNASGHGTYSGKGLKGQHSRSGGSNPAGFEGGRTTLILQTPKARGEGFVSGRPRWFGINVEKLNSFADGSKITDDSLRSAGLVKMNHVRVKILGGGRISKKLQIAVPVSASAKEKIEKAGGHIVSPESEKTVQ